MQRWYVKDDGVGSPVLDSYFRSKEGRSVVMKKVVKRGGVYCFELIKANVCKR